MVCHGQLRFNRYIIHKRAMFHSKDFTYWRVNPRGLSTIPALRAADIFAMICRVGKTASGWKLGYTTVWRCLKVHTPYPQKNIVVSLLPLVLALLPRRWIFNAHLALLARWTRYFCPRCVQQGHTKRGPRPWIFWCSAPFSASLEVYPMKTLDTPKFYIFFSGKRGKHLMIATNMGVAMKAHLQWNRHIAETIQACLSAGF